MSKKEKDYIIFLEDILEAIEKIEKYTQNLTYQEFCKNEMVVDAVIRNFEVIGEAANNVPQEIRELYSEVEWREAISFRNVLIHDYFGIYVETVWDTIKKNIPSLKNHITLALNAERKKNHDKTGRS
jgi:uncharacterized protein with HEPN domain